MSTQSGPWYIRGEGNQPAGPFTADQLIQSWRAGRLDANTICWREGMSQWLPLAQVELFASAIASAGAPWQATAGAAPSPAPCAAVSALPRAASRPPGRGVPASWIASAVGVGLAAVGAVAAYVIITMGSGMPAALRYMPDGTKAFMSVDVAALRNSKLYADTVEATGAPIETMDQNLKNEMGIALADVSRVSVGADFDMETF